MANEQNLRPSEYKLSQEEAKRGGIASGIARRKKADLKKTLEEMLQGGNGKNNLTYEQQIALGLIANAIDSKKGGNPRSYEVIAKMLGQYQDSETSLEDAPDIKIEIIDNNYDKGEEE